MSSGYLSWRNIHVMRGTRGGVSRKQFLYHVFFISLVNDTNYRVEARILNIQDSSFKCFLGVWSKQTRLGKVWGVSGRESWGDGVTKTFFSCVLFTSYPNTVHFSVTSWNDSTLFGEMGYYIKIDNSSVLICPHRKKDASTTVPCSCFWISFPSVKDQ